MHLFTDNGLYNTCSGVVPMGPKYFEKMKQINYFGVKSILHRFCSRVIYPPPSASRWNIFFTDYWVGWALSSHTIGATELHARNHNQQYTHKLNIQQHSIYKITNDGKYTRTNFFSLPGFEPHSSSSPLHHESQVCYHSAIQSPEFDVSFPEKLLKIVATQRRHF